MRYLAFTFFGLLVVMACQQKRLSEIEEHPGKFETERQQSSSDYEWVREKIDSAMRANNIPAVSVGVIRNGKLAYAAGFGEQERGNKTMPDENTLYQIGSDTKKFTAIIVRNLVSEGKMDLNESIVVYLPEIFPKEVKTKLKGITVKDLLLHNSGLPNRAPGNKRIDGDPMLIEYTEKDLINDLNGLDLEFEPGTNFSYSNFGYAVLGYVSERASGNDYSELLQKYVTEEYHMKNTFIYPNLRPHPPIATPYRKDDRNVKSQPWNMGKLAPAGGVYSNVTDISKLMVAQIETYKAFYGNRRKDHPLLLTENDGIEGSHYGFGLGKTVKEHGIHYGHGGDLDGFASGYVFSPEKNTGLILLTTSGGEWFGQLEKALFDRLNQ